MQSEYQVQQLSRGRGPSVHRYYDVAVEEPGGDRILYFEFESDSIPGPGHLIVADANGGNPREIAHCTQAIGHVGGNGTWVGKGRVAFSPEQMTDTGAIVRHVDGGAQDIQLPADLRSYGEHNQLAILLGDPGFAQADRYAGRQILRTWHSETGEVRDLLRAPQAYELHPDRETFDLAKTNFQNPKWSPDGRHFLVVFGTQLYRKSTGHADYPSIKALLVADADGQNVRYMGEFGHHPMWHPDGSGLVAYMKGEAGGQDLLFYPLDGSETEVFMPDLTGVHCTLDRAAGRLVTDVFDKPNDRAQVMLVDVPGGERLVLAEGRHEVFDHVSGSHMHPQWSRDESQIFFNMADTGVPQVYALTL